MADNTEYLPQIEPIDDSRTYREGKIIGGNNVVDPTAKNVIVTGFSNFIGEDTNNIAVMNSTGCAVSSGVTDTFLLNCSGLTILDSGLTYIANTLIAANSFSGGAVNTGYRVETLDEQSITATDATVELSGGVVTAIGLPPAAGHNRIYNVKNLQSINADVETYGVGDWIDSINYRVTLTQYDSVTLQSNGVDNYIII